MEDYYHILGITPNATQEEINRRYRFLVLAYHPDRFSEETRGEASKEMARINRAYEVLSDPLKRSAYDRQRSNQSPSYGKSTSNTTGSSDNSEASHPEEDKTYYRDSTNRINEAFEYFENLISRWKPYLQNVSRNPQRDLILHKCKDTIRVISEKLSDYMGEQGKALFREEMDTFLAAVIVINVALGIELEAASPPAGFTQQDLIEYSIIPIRSQINFVLNYGKSRGAYKQVQVSALNEQIVAELKALCQVYQQEGQSIAAALRRSPKNSQKADYRKTSQSRPLIQYCQSCGSIGPTKNLTFTRMIGLVVFAHFRRVKGEMCATCAVNYFWKFSGMTLLLGWISVFVIGLPFILLANWINYLKSGEIRKDAPDLSGVASGWKTFTILATIVAFIAFFVYLSTSRNNNVQSSNSTSYGYQPTTAPLRTATFRPKPSLTVSIALPARPTDDGCMKWNEVSTLQKGKKVCVYGIVKDAYRGDERRFFITFGNNISAFRMIVLGGYYYKDVIGNCVESTGIIKVYENMPYMELGEKIRVYETTSRCLE